jgi:maltose-binding protein MalE
LATTSPAAVGPTPAPIIPGAFVTSAASTDPNIAPALATIRQNFTQAVQTNTSDPNSPQYATDWQTAQSLADDLLHERVGDVAFNQIEHDAAQASAAAAPPSPRH